MRVFDDQMLPLTPQPLCLALAQGMRVVDEVCAFVLIIGAMIFHVKSIPFSVCFHVNASVI